MGFPPVQSRPNCATRYAEIAWTSSGADMPQRSYMLATTVSQSRFCRLTTVTRSRLWQTAQRVSTSSLPGPLGSAAAVAAGAPGPKLLNDGVGLARRQLRAAQHHVVDVLLPADRPVAARHDDVQGVALRAGGRDQVAALSRRQRARGLGAKRRGGAENERKHADEHKTPHGHTL